MAFGGWPAEAIEFYEGLEADNSKTYWQAHKAEYEELVLRPMQELLDELAPEFGDGKIFRPYRDVRFRADKSPYKTAMGASLSRGGYVHFGTDGLGAGCGYYMLAPDQLERYRAAVDAERTGRELSRLVATVTKKGIEVSAHDSLKTVPRGYPKDHPRADLLRQKGLITWKQWPVGAWLGTSEARKRVVQFLRDSKPITAWLDTNVGATTMGDERRR